MIRGIGTDMIEFMRIERVGVDRLAQRILTKREQACLPPLPKRRREYVSGRFAAKEAIAKALGTGIGGACSFQDIEVINGELGKPMVRLSSELKERMFGSREIQIYLSITHSEAHALAMAVIEEME